MVNIFLFCKQYYICRNSGEHFLGADFLIDLFCPFFEILYSFTVLFTKYTRTLLERLFIFLLSHPGNFQNLGFFFFFWGGVIDRK